MLCTNTMHKVAPAIEAATTIPLLHLVDATAEVVTATGIGLLQMLTMKQDAGALFQGVALNSPQYLHLVAEIQKRGARPDSHHSR